MGRVGRYVLLCVDVLEQMVCQRAAFSGLKCVRYAIMPMLQKGVGVTKR